MDLSMIDVRAHAYGALVLICDCGWNEGQDPGGPTLPTLIGRAEAHVREAHAAKPSGCPGCPGPRVAHQHYATGGIDAVLAAQGYVGDWTNYDTQASDA